MCSGVCGEEERYEMSSGVCVLKMGTSVSCTEHKMYCKPLLCGIMGTSICVLHGVCRSLKMQH